MGRHGLWLALLTSLAAGSAVTVRTEQIAQSSAVAQQPRTGNGGSLFVIGRVSQVYEPRLFTVENRLSEDRQLLVLLPESAAMPLAGSMVQVRGVLRRVDKAEAGTRPWSEIQERVPGGLTNRSVLVAASVSSAGRDSLGGMDRRPQLTGVTPASRTEITVRPAALAGLIGQLAGLRVRVPDARVVGLFNPRAFLIDSAVRLPPPLGHRDRVLVLVDAGALRIPAESIVASTVTVLGVARTMLGMQVTSEVPWPPALDPDAVDRLEVRAVVLATSVRTADGVELTDRPPRD